MLVTQFVMFVGFIISVSARLKFPGLARVFVCGRCSWGRCGGQPRGVPISRQTKVCLRGVLRFGVGLGGGVF